jgi:hypothetical protein
MFHDSYCRRIVCQFDERRRIYSAVAKPNRIAAQAAHNKAKRAASEPPYDRGEVEGGVSLPFLNRKGGSL